MASVAIYNSKGGVGKTTLAINLASEAARAGYRTLLWEIDEQGDSSWMLLSEQQRCGKEINAKHFMMSANHLLRQVQESKVDNLSILSADTNLRNTENFLVQFARGQKLSKLFSELEKQFDVIFLDCPPGFSEANRKLLLFAQMVVVPIIPSPFAERGLRKIRDFMIQNRGHHPPILPVFSMVDRRRRIHKEFLKKNPQWPIIPMAAVIEEMSVRKLPLVEFASNSSSSKAFASLWQGIARKLKSMVVLRSHEEVPAAIAASQEELDATSPRARA